jgi:phage protein D
MAGTIADFEVRINGVPLPISAQMDIRSVTVQEDREGFAMFTLVLYNWDDGQLKVSWSDSKLFAIGNEVTIALGYLNDLQPMIVAEIISLEPAFTADQPPMLTVRGYDRGHRLGRGSKTRLFSQMTDSSIASKLALDAGLAAQVEDTRITLERVMQSNQTDWEFLQERARQIGYEAYVNNKTLYFQRPQNARPAAIKLAVGDDIREFTPRLSSQTQVDKVSVRGWDMKSKQVIVGDAGVGQETTTMGGGSSGPRGATRAFGRATVASVTMPVQSKAEADQIALGRFNDVALAYIEGDVACNGRAQLHAGTVVNIAGAGKTFSGAYYVTSVTHTVTPDQGYRMSLTVQRNAT